MSDSTNSEREGYSMSESSVGKVFDNIFTGCTKRIIVATFASNVHRVQQIVNSAMKNNRKVAIIGLGVSNLPLLDYLHEKNANVTVFDSRTIDEISKGGAK